MGGLGQGQREDTQQGSGVAERGRRSGPGELADLGSHPRPPLRKAAF